MASKPFHTSTKEPMSVKLRGLNASKSVTRQLEIDSRRMEERLRELKVAMGREKQERERQGSAGSVSIWSSAKPGALTTHGNEVLKKNPSKPTKPGETKIRKIKVLKDTPLELPKRAPKKAPASNPPSFRKSFSGPPCGQCEERAVALTCMECGENYCAGCFAKFHLKGALRQHRSIPYQSGSKENSPRLSNGTIPNNNVKPSVPKTNSVADSRSKKQEKVIIASTAPPQNSSPNPGKSTFDGDYNEEESAASFAAALAEWRQAKKGGQQTQNGRTSSQNGSESKKDVHDMGSGTATTNDSRKPVEISFHDNPSMSYADRLLLKKHRRTDLPSALSPTPSQLANHYMFRESHSSMGQADLTNGDFDPTEEELEMEEEHQRYTGMFAPSTPTPQEMERPKSNITIMEITEEDTPANAYDMEVQSVYSVQEWDSVTNSPSPHITLVGSSKDAPETIIQSKEGANQRGGKMSSANGANRFDPRGKKSMTMEMQQAKPSSAKTTQPKARSPGKPEAAGKIQKEKSPTSSVQQSSRQDQKQMESASRKPSTVSAKQREQAMRSSSKAGDRSKSGLGSASSKARDSKSGLGSASSKARDSGSKQRDSSGQQRSMKDTRKDLDRKQPDLERPPSAGITTLPSGELREITKMRVAWQHQQGYKEGLGSFFMGGVEGDEEGEKERGADERITTPTNVLPECSYKGPSAWRPDSSLSNHPDQATPTMSPSPPKQARDARSPNLSARKRSSLNSATGSNQSSTSSATGGRSSENGANSATKQPSTKQKQGASAGAGKAKGSGSEVDNTLHWRFSSLDKHEEKQRVGGGSNPPGGHSAASSAFSMQPRSSSRIEVDGDDLTGYDEDGQMGKRDEEDEVALGQLEWELASNQGRITADGRISSMLGEINEMNLFLMSDEYQDQALGIEQDDGMGSGLSTPCNDLSLDRLSDEDMRSDFETAADIQTYREEVQALEN